MKARKKTFALLLMALLAAVLSSGCLGFGKKKNRPDDTGSVAPDKVLYERAMNDIKHGRYTIGRLTLQTLINTYPDSEYLAKAKLAIADSYYREGGTSGLTQAVAEYKDFITFFPFLDEAAYAQMQVAMAHYRMMQKPDRDRTQAQLAEEELQTFLLKYPQSPLVPQAKQHLREVQEVLAEGDYRVARFYYIRRAYRASAARLVELTDRYPLYSQADRVNWMLADVYQKAERSDIAAKYYARIVRDYPLSQLVPDAKKKLIALGVPVPQPDPGALARMQQEQQVEREKPGILSRSVGFLKTGPDVSMAARTGEPNLSPPSETPSATEVLRPSGGNLTVGGSNSSSAGGANSSVAVETVSPSSSANSPTTNSGPSTAANDNSSNPSTESNSSVRPNSTDAKLGLDPSKTSEATSKQEDSKKGKESSSKKKKKGLRKIIPW